MLDSICIFLSFFLPRNIYKPWEACTATVAVCIHNMLESSYYVYCTSRTISKLGIPAVQTHTTRVVVYES